MFLPFTVCIGAMDVDLAQLDVATDTQTSLQRMLERQVQMERAQLQRRGLNAIAMMVHLLIVVMS